MPPSNIHSRYLGIRIYNNRGLRVCFNDGG